MHHQQNLMDKKRKKIECLLHECALLVKEYFRIQRNLLNSLKPKYFTYKKEVRKARAPKTSLT